MTTQRPLIVRGTKAAAEQEAEKLEPAARRMGYGVEVRGTLRRYGKSQWTGAPYGVYLTKAPERAQESPEHPSGGKGVRGGSKGRTRPLRAV